MYRKIKVLSTVIIKSASAVMLLLSVSCTKYRTKDSEIPKVNTSITPCPVNTVISATGNCIVQGSGNFVYSQAFGGRGLNQTDQVGLNGALTVVLPDGWYEGRSVSIKDTNLQSSNITATNSFFGVTGNLTSGAFAACGGINSHIANPSTCDIPATNYVYSSDYGGRLALCPASGMVTTPCWLAGSNFYLNGSASASCTAEGLLSAKCRVPVSTYWYLSPYTGRSAVCTMNAVNGAACWTNAPSIYVYDASCVDGYNGAACVTPSAKYVYSVQYGGRNVDCTSNSAGSCYFSAAKNTVEPNLIAGNIKLGYTMFGIAGAYGGVTTNWGSGMARDLAQAQISLSVETSTYAGINSTLPAGYRAIPKIATDSEGGILEVTPQVNVVNRTTWGATTCGTDPVAYPSVGARISHCQTVFGANATWVGSTAGNQGQGSWSLVSRSGSVAAGKGREVWRDQTTGLLWSSLVSTGINWCKAIGNNNSSNSNITAQNLNEVDPIHICDQVSYQNQAAGNSVISACSEFVGMTTTDAAIDNLGKSGLSKTSIPVILWRAPSIYDYMIANQNGIRFVLPDMQSGSLGNEWTSTVYSIDRTLAFTIDAATGQKSVQDRRYSNNLRCIGR